jgi:hypothetical protein
MDAGNGKTAKTIVGMDSFVMVKKCERFIEQVMNYITTQLSHMTYVFTIHAAIIFVLILLI